MAQGRSTKIISMIKWILDQQVVNKELYLLRVWGMGGEGAGLTA